MGRAARHQRLLHRGAQSLLEEAHRGVLRGGREARLAGPPAARTLQVRLGRGEAARDRDLPLHPPAAARPGPRARARALQARPGVAVALLRTLRLRRRDRRGARRGGRGLRSQQADLRPGPARRGDRPVRHAGRGRRGDPAREGGLRLRRLHVPHLVRDGRASRAARSRSRCRPLPRRSRRSCAAPVVADRSARSRPSASTTSGPDPLEVHSRNSGITSLANSSMEANTSRCGIAPPRVHPDDEVVHPDTRGNSRIEGTRPVRSGLRPPPSLANLDRDETRAGFSYSFRGFCRSRRTARRAGRAHRATLSVPVRRS